MTSESKLHTYLVNEIDTNKKYPLRLNTKNAKASAFVPAIYHQFEPRGKTFKSFVLASIEYLRFVTKANLPLCLITNHDINTFGAM